MPIAYWREEYACGFTQIDEQHKMLFQVINTLHDAMLQGEGRQVLKKTLQELIEYTLEHFETEESLMLTHNYPEYDAHVKRHRELTTDVLQLAEKFEQNQAFLTVELSHFLTDWLIHHIKGEDRKMIKFFREKKQKQTVGLWTQIED